MRVLLVLCICLSISDSIRVLGVFPFGSASHYMAFEPLMLELAHRGHNVTVYSPFPQKTKVPNFTDISLHDSVKLLHNSFLFHTYQEHEHNMFNDLSFFNVQVADLERVLQSSIMQDLINSNETFDMVITEYFTSEVMLAFGHRFHAPYIAMTASTLMPWASYLFDNPSNPSYVPNLFMPYNNHMTFMQRMNNVYKQLFYLISYRYKIMPKTREIIQKYFGTTAPSPDDLVKNASLLFVNTYFGLQGSQPFAKRVIETGGIHVKPVKKLPQNLEEYISSSENGIVYFSLGSILKGSTLKNETWRAFRDVFAKLPERVLWKWEEDTMIDQPNNVKLIKWAPQRDILAHENVKLFITHGGLLSLTEAVTSGVPVVGIPVYGDQSRNMAVIEANRAGIKLDIHELTYNNIFSAVHTVLSNHMYRINAKQLANKFNDRPMSALDTAVYWTEYVIRHNGAPHLRSAVSDLSWYQLVLLDVIGVSFIFTSVVVVIIICILKIFLKVLYSFNKSKQE